jgi:hypothetical protein
MVVAAVSSPKARQEVLMRVASFAIALVIAGSVSLAGQPALKSTRVSFEIVDASLTEVLDLIGRIAEIDIEVDDAVPEEVRDRKIDTAAFHTADLESVLKVVTSYHGLTFDIVDENTIDVRLPQ